MFATRILCCQLENKQSRDANWVITGLVNSTYAEASSQQTGDDEPISAAENHMQTAMAVLELSHEAGCQTFTK